MLHAWFGMSHRQYSFAALGFVAITQFVLIRWIRNSATAGATLSLVAFTAYLIKLNLTPVAVLNSFFLFLWGLRLSLKGIPILNSSEILSQRPAFEIAVNRTIWIWLLSAPTVYATSMDTPDKEPLIWVVTGAFLCFAAILYDYIENDENNKGKYCRHPYAMSSSLLNWGLFLMRPSLVMLPFPLIFFIILYAAPGGACWNEAASRQRFLLVRDEDMLRYKKETSAYIPCVPQVLDTLPTRVKQILVW
jgi:hypothetical protein